MTEHERPAEYLLDLAASGQAPPVGHFYDNMFRYWFGGAPSPASLGTRYAKRKVHRKGLQRLINELGLVAEVSGPGIISSRLRDLDVERGAFIQIRRKNRDFVNAPKYRIDPPDLREQAEMMLKYGFHYTENYPEDLAGFCGQVHWLGKIISPPGSRVRCWVDLETGEPVMTFRARIVDEAGVNALNKALEPWPVRPVPLHWLDDQYLMVALFWDHDKKPVDSVTPEPPLPPVQPLSPGGEWYRDHAKSYAQSLELRPLTRDALVSMVTKITDADKLDRWGLMEWLAKKLNAYVVTEELSITDASNVLHQIGVELNDPEAQVAWRTGRNAWELQVLRKTGFPMPMDDSG